MTFELLELEGTSELTPAEGESGDHGAAVAGEHESYPLTQVLPVGGKIDVQGERVVACAARSPPRGRHHLVTHPVQWPMWEGAE